jgi:DNA-binding MurR/RpiR family transcriptional regulator
MNAKARIKAQIPALSESEKTVADWILNNAETVLRMPMAQVAKICQVSDATVLRMCRNAGFAGFSDMKMSLAQDSMNPTQIIHEDIQPADNTEAIIRKVYASNIQALYDTLEMTDFAAMGRAVELIASAKKVQIAAVGGSLIVAQALSQRLFRNGIACDAPADIHLQIIHASLLNPEDVLIAVSYSGRTKDIVLMLENAQANHVQTILITGNPKSRAAALSTLVLTSVSHEIRSEPIAARIAQISIVDSLSILYAFRNVEKTIAFEKRIENALFSKT